MSIEVHSLTKTFGTQVAVDHINFSVGKGEIVGFLGPNGAGKSTTMKMITGYLLPDEGNISICGLDVLRQPIESRRKIGYLPESNPLYYDMYVKEFLSFIGGIYRVDQRMKKVEEVIEQTGLGEEQSKKIGQLSKGYKQRVGLAHALIHDPEVLILDEPISGLDPNQLVEIRDLILEIGRSKTVLFSTHIMQEVEAICDRVIIINKGKIVADDLIDKLQRPSGDKEILQILLDRPLSIDAFRQINGLNAINSLDPAVFVLEFDPSQDIRPALFEMVKRMDRKILEMTVVHEGVEEVFRKLTEDNRSS